MATALKQLELEARAAASEFYVRSVSTRDYPTLEGYVEEWWEERHLPEVLLRAAGPVPMILHCPECGARHVDEGEFSIEPHHTHACQECGFVWRPARVDTVGVQFLPGYKD